MELGLTLGDSPPPAKAAVAPTVSSAPADGGEDDELVLELGVGAGQLRDVEEKQQGDHKIRDIQPAEEAVKEEEEACPPPGEPPAELIGLRRRLSDPPETGNANLEVCTRGFDVNAAPLSQSSLQMATQVWRADELQEGVEEEEEEKGGGGARKKLRLSKDQSAFLEESFKEHTTPTPKQKSDLAKRLNLRRRQVEVWFQNRRARTKLKQTEVDCEHLKRRCETLAQENRRLHREVAALRASRAATYHPFFYTHLSATTAVSACPACHKLTSAYSPPSVATSGRRRPLG